MLRYEGKKEVTHVTTSVPYIIYKMKLATRVVSMFSHTVPYVENLYGFDIYYVHLL
jgi:hypothetical protein